MASPSDIRKQESDGVPVGASTPAPNGRLAAPSVAPGRGSAESRPGDLKTRAIKSTGWYASTRVWTQAVSWGITIVLARLLTPADYGLFGMASAVIGFLQVFQYFGLGTAIIQRQHLSRPQLNTISWIVVGGGVALFSIVFGLAGPVAAYYAEPRLVWIIRALGLLFFLTAISIIPQSLLTKELDFRRRSYVEASGLLPGAVVSIALAYVGSGVWALVFGQLVRIGIQTATVVLVTGWRPGFDLSFRDVRSILGFGSTVAAASIVSEVSHLLGVAVLGRMLGSQTFGLYTMAVTLGFNPFNRLSAQLINQLSLPVFSKIQGDRGQLRSWFLMITRYLALIAIPMQVGIALVAADLVSVVLSEQWQGMVHLLQVISIGGIWSVVILPSAPLLTARGRTGLTLAHSTAYSALMPLGFLVGARYGLIGVATVWILLYCPLRSVLAWLAIREIDLRLRAYLASVAAPATAALAMAAATLVVRHLWPLGAAPLQGLVRDVVCGAAVYCLLLWRLDRRLPGELRGIWRTLRAKQGG